MEEQSQQQQEKDSKTLSEKIDGSGEGGSSAVEAGQEGGGSVDEVVSANVSNSGSNKGGSCSTGGDTTEKEREPQPESESKTKPKKKDNDRGNLADCPGPRTSGDPGPSTRTKDNRDPYGKEKESFPSLFISHASINISGSNPDISESEKLKISCREGGGGGADSSGVSKTDLDSSTIPQRVVVHRVCSDSRIGEGEGFHSSKLTSFFAADGNLTNSLKALGLSLNNKEKGSKRKNSGKSNKQKPEGTGGNGQDEGTGNGNLNNKNNNSVTSTGNSIKSRNQAVNVNTESKPTTEEKGCGGGEVSETAGERRSSGGERGSCTTGSTNIGGGKRTVDLLPTIEQSVSEHIKTEHPSTSEGEETITEDVVDEDEELLDEYDEPNENLECQLDFDAAVTELLLRPEVADAENIGYKDSATWTAEDDMPSPSSDISPVASPLRKKERNNIYRELERDCTAAAVASTGTASGHSHNSLLEQYHQYLLEQQQQHHNSKQPQVHSSRRGGSGSKSGGSGGSISSHHTHGGVSGSGHPHLQQHHSNPNSSIVGIHQGNLKSQSHSQSHHHHSHHHHHSQHHHPPLPPPPPPHHQQAECFTVSSQLLSREAKLYENVPATQGELETLEILLASGGSGDSNYPPSGGSGSGGGASNTTASTSNTSGTSGQSHSHKNSSNHGNNLNNNHNSNNNSHHSHHHRSNHSQQTHHQQQSSHHQTHHPHHNHHLFPQGFVHGQHSHSANNLNTSNTAANSSEQLFSVSDFLGPGGGLSVGGNNNGGPPSRTSWADSGRESLSFDGENNNSTGSTRNLLLIPPPPPPPINYLASTSGAAVHNTFGGNGASSTAMHSSHHSHHHGGGGGTNKHSSSGHHSHHHSSRDHHHHHHTQSQMSSDSPSHTSHQTHRDTRRSRRERLVRQKHAVNDETLYPQPHSGSDKGLGGMIDAGGGFMVVPSPRRIGGGTNSGILSGGMQASNFIAAAASPINLQRHPPASQIMLQENKKNGALIACESPYGIMAGGTSTVGTSDWAYPETFGDHFRRPTNKSHLTGNILRTKSPHRSRGLGDGSRKGNNNSSFDYGELPSHQMFPKRHLLQTRQFSGHHRGYTPSGGNGTMQNNGVNTGVSGGLCPPTGFQPMQHRSFPAGVFR